jgi:hypothetical protein
MEWINGDFSLFHCVFASWGKFEGKGSERDFEVKLIKRKFWRAFGWLRSGQRFLTKIRRKN